MATDDRENLSAEELEWQNRRKERAKRMRLEKEKQLKKQKLFKQVLPVVAIVLLAGIVIVAVSEEQSPLREMPGKRDMIRNLLWRMNLHNKRSLIGKRILMRQI